MKCMPHVTKTDKIPKEIYEHRNFSIQLPNTKKRQFVVGVFNDGSVLDGKKLNSVLDGKKLNGITKFVFYCASAVHLEKNAVVSWLHRMLSCQGSNLDNKFFPKIILSLLLQCCHL